MSKSLIEHFETFITKNRVELFNSVLEKRTRYITVVLEDIFQPHNASAVLRSCDCFGIQDVHIIEESNQYKVNKDVALGADKWLTMHKHSGQNNNAEIAINNLKEKGYRIVATTPHKKGVELENLNLNDGKIALCFGTEMNGLSDTIIKKTDEYVTIVMHGFTESFNISVSAAIILHHLTRKLYSSNINWQLTQQEKNEVKLNWLRKSIKKSGLIEKSFLTKIANSQNHKKDT
ncbi:MAG: RNA methyltransferase [Bacteroidales bacterium]|nr:RNA methyltransferase [Bacteroidales bacterium]